MWQENWPLPAQADREAIMGAVPYTEEERKRDFAGEISALAKTNEALKKVDADVKAAKDDEAKKKLAATKEELSARLQELTTTIAGRRSWDFGDQDALLLQYDIISELVDKLEKFSSDEQGPIKSIEARLKSSREIEEKTLNEPSDAWVLCRERIKQNELYSGFILKPQLGLIPLGPDPDSDLEEFLHFLTHKGAVPKRGDEEEIRITDDLGVILVLIPGGTFLMGSQKSNPKKPNYDPNGLGNEGPVHKVTLASYFLSKYEMTQGQWQQSFADNPSRYPAGSFANDSRFKAPINLRHPVEQVSWLDAQKYLPLFLPSFRILHPILASTLCAPNPLAFIGDPKMGGQLGRSLALPTDPDLRFLSLPTP